MREPILDNSQQKQLNKQKNQAKTSVIQIEIPESRWFIREKAFRTVTEKRLGFSLLVAGPLYIGESEVLASVLPTTGKFLTSSRNHSSLTHESHK